MEASGSLVVESPTEPDGALVEAPVAPEVPVEQGSDPPVTTEAIPESLDPPAPFPTPEPASVDIDPAFVAPAMTPGKIELSTGKTHDIQDIGSVVNLSVQAGAGFEELIRADGKPIWVSVAEIVSYE